MPMKTSTALTGFALVGATALALAVPALAPHLADRLTPPLLVPRVIQTETQATESGPSTLHETKTVSKTTSATRAQTKGIVLIRTRLASAEAAGTGMVLTPGGQVLTNYHVVQGSVAVEVAVADTGETYQATVVGHDASRDVALLQLKGASGLATITPDKDPVTVGQPLTAVGNASGRGELVAATGKVTKLDQQVTVKNDQGGTENLRGVIATNAGAVQGDSGGPMFDDQGEVLGMTTAGNQTVTRSPESGSPQATTTSSFAVPISDALSVVNQIRTGKASGTVRVGNKAFLGITVAESSSLVVSSVQSGGAAAKAGVTVGSVITSVGGTAVGSHDDIASRLNELNPGAKTKLTWVDADGARRSATVALGRSPVN